MASDGTFEQRIAAATSSAEVAELCRQQGETAAVLVRERDGSVTVRESFAMPTPAPPASQQPDNTLLRRAVTLSDGTVRLIEAWSVYGLDILESAIKHGQI